MSKEKEQESIQKIVEGFNELFTNLNTHSYINPDELTKISSSISLLHEFCFEFKYDKDLLNKINEIDRKFSNLSDEMWSV